MWSNQKEPFITQIEVNISVGSEIDNRYVKEYDRLNRSAL